MRLYLVRHGKTEVNERGFRQSPDTGLSENGVTESKNLAEWLKDTKFDVLLSSPWTRAKETAEIIANRLDLRIKYLDELHEKEHNPDLYGVTMDSEINLQYEREHKKNRNNIDWKLRGGGESVREMLDRGVRLRDKLIESYCDKTVLAVSHAYFIKGFICNCIMGDNFDDVNFIKVYWAIAADNNGVSLLEYDPEKRKWVIKFLNFIPNFRG